MTRHFLTFKRLVALVWDLLPALVTMYVHSNLSATFPTVSKIFAVSSLFLAFLSGLKTGFAYHRFLIHRDE